MSRWSNDWLGEGIGIGVGTREVAVGPRVARWPGSRRAASEPEVRLVSMQNEQCYTEHGVFDALRAAFETEPDKEEAASAKSGRSQTRSAHIVLDDFWGNHAVLRGDFRALRAREIDEVAHAHFADTYGVDAQAISVRVCVQRGGRAAFASALPRTLVDGVRDAGASAGVEVRALKLCLPEMLNRALDTSQQPDTMLIFAADELLQAVLIQAGRWAGYDAQRLFPDDARDPGRIAALAEQAFEHCAERTNATREACALALHGIDVDPAPLEARFASVSVYASSSREAADNTARRLLEYAQ
ncbi:hypothetical protein G3N95_11510 [Paraburkholderia sp. Tr-20389]|uniref:hypothetical protein n=1 Tax=Paraburkholderia sp. Tr-20389 TaxID=2703903 RepID=UPI0019822EAF|nr:hypothetical protein [Paraburkholderia sp. Tr-20389]MBN3753568.1 hypothetical protein [Paraburkholderia sp. Tr-20389]